ncbi:hypothetical protein P9209_18020 [Prescottella defluvii]|nr:hypothetical protein P9209_18020 [Prescottella defluvii]
MGLGDADNLVRAAQSGAHRRNGIHRRWLANAGEVMANRSRDTRRVSHPSEDRRATHVLWVLAFVLLPLIPGAIATANGLSPYGIFWTTAWAALAIGVAAALSTSS